MSTPRTRVFGSAALLAASAVCWWLLSGGLVVSEWARFSASTGGVVMALAGIGVLLVTGPLRTSVDLGEESPEIVIE